METLLLLHFKRDPNGLLALSAGWESLFLRDELQREGTVFQLFLPELPNGYELLEEIGTYHPSRLILCADGENQAVVTGFLSFLNKAAPGLEAKIVHVGPPASGAEAPCRSVRFYESGLCPLEQYRTLGLPLAVCLGADGLSCTLSVSAEDVQAELRFLTQALPDVTEALFCADDPGLPIPQALQDVCAAFGLSPRLLPRRSGTAPACQALWNGAAAFLSGIYPGLRDLGAAVKHILLEDADCTEETLCGLSRFADGNHTLFFPAACKERLAAATAPERSGVTGYLPCNQMAVQAQGGGKYSFELNGGPRQEEYTVVPYAAYEPDGSPHPYVCLAGLQDFDQLEADFRAFSKTGRLPHPRMWQPELIDKCRFWAKNNCSLDCLPRLHVKNGGLFPCLSSDYCAGSIEEDPFDIAMRLRGKKARTSLERQCGSCLRAESCSRCAVLPAFLPQERFCAFMKDEMDLPYLRGAVLGLVYLSRMRQLPELADPAMGCVQAVTLQSGILLPPPRESAAWQLDPTCFLYRVEGENTRNLLFSLKTCKALKVNDNFFRLCECLCRGYTAGDVAQDTALCGPLDPQEIAPLYAEVRRTLSAYGMAD